MVNGVIIKKIEILDECYQELKKLGIIEIDDLKKNWIKKRAIERNLQIMVEIMIDICQRILALNGQLPAKTSVESIKKCVEIGVIKNEKTYEKMVQFRNFIVHRYENIDLNILINLVNNKLEDFNYFKTEILNYEKNKL